MGDADTRWRFLNVWDGDVPFVCTLGDLAAADLADEAGDLFCFGALRV